jgi:DNA mismatch repair protein MutS
MFATHYHELTALEGEISGVKNYNISAKKRGGDIIFLRKIIPGGADDSYGIEVAHLAGVPDAVIKRANVILSEMVSSAPAAPVKTVSADNDDSQFSLESIAENEVIEQLKRTDINTITPLEAMNLLFEFKKKVSG